ncbi:520_t:CDS:2, partial [Acaulospora colombiana]
MLRLAARTTPRASKTLVPFTRYASTNAKSTLKSLRETLAEVIPEKQNQLKQLRAEHGQAVLGDVKVENIIGGMRGLKAMLWEASVLDPNEKVLAPAQGGKEIIPESMLWLLLTGKIPSEAQVRALSKEFAENGTLDDKTVKLIDGLDPSMHPMTQFGIAVASLNMNSKFAAAYERGIKKTEYWTYVLEDSLDLIAKLPSIAARIYYNIKNPGKAGSSDGAYSLAVNPKLDLVGNYVEQLGLGGNDSLTEYLRLYIALHDLVGSALSDPYLSYSAALFGLAGPLHGLANQEVLRWILAMQKTVGDNASPEKIKEYLWSTLNSGQVVPGYGHGVLRSPDPRFIALQQFCDARPELSSSAVIRLVKQVSEIAPGVLKEHGK